MLDPPQRRLDEHLERLRKGGINTNKRKNTNNSVSESITSKRQREYTPYELFSDRKGRGDRESVKGGGVEKGRGAP